MLLLATFFGRVRLKLCLLGRLLAGRLGRVEAVFIKALAIA